MLATIPVDTMGSLNVGYHPRWHHMFTQFWLSSQLIQCFHWMLAIIPVDTIFSLNVGNEPSWYYIFTQCWLWTQMILYFHSMSALMQLVLVTLNTMCSHSVGYQPSWHSVFNWYLSQSPKYIRLMVIIPSWHWQMIYLHLKPHIQNTVSVLQSNLCLYLYNNWLLKDVIYTTPLCASLNVWNHRDIHNLQKHDEICML